MSAARIHDGPGGLLIAPLGAEATVVEEARKALAAHGRGDLAAYNTHRANARRLAEQLGLHVVHTARHATEAAA